MNNPFSQFVTPDAPVEDSVVSTDPNPYTQFIEPVGKVEGRAGQRRSYAYRGDSQYDTGLTPGMDQMRNRAMNQPWYDQLGNQGAKLVPAIALGIIENAGYLGELFDNSHDYTNAVTEFAKKHRESWEESHPIYRQDPNAVFDLGDFGWWAQHGGGLVESIGEFLVTGAGVGGILGKTAKGLASVMKANAAISAGMSGAAQLGTSGFLAYTEGAMSGADIYKRVLEETGDVEKAAQAAAHTVRLNTTINTVLNLSSISPMFKTLGNLKSTSKIGLHRLPGEAIDTWDQRITALVEQGYQPASLRKALLLEAGQESLEELVNLHAEQEGLIVGGLAKPTSGTQFGRFIKTAATEEGALSALLGAVGGIGQTAGMSLLPFRNYTDEDGNVTRVNNYELEALQNNRAMQEQLSIFQEDIKHLRNNQKALNAALEAGDIEAIKDAREELFNITTLKSIREGVAEEFSQDLENIANTDNVQIGEDGLTEAMRKGYADSQEDNEYKTTARQRIQDLKTLSKDYQSIRNAFKNKFVADEVFRKRIAVYSKENRVNEIRKADQEATESLLKQTRKYNILQDDLDPFVADAVSLAANVSALNFILASENKDTDPRFYNNLRNSLTVEAKLLQDRLQEPEVKKRLDDHQGLVKQLTLSRVNLIAENEALNILKGDYDQALRNPTQTTEDFTKALRELEKQIAKEEAEKAKAEQRIKEEADKKEAQAKKEVKEAEEVKKAAEKASAKETKEPTIESFVERIKKGEDMSSPEDLQFYENNKDEIEASLKEGLAGEGPSVEDESVETSEEEEESEEGKVILAPSPKPDESYNPRTVKEEEQEQEELQAAVEVVKEPVSATKVAYASRPYGTNSGPILEKFWAPHSSRIKAGTPVVLQLAETQPEKVTAANATIEIVTKEGELVGYIGLPKGNDPLLNDIRSHVFANKTVESSITSKSLGKINWGNQKQTVDIALPQVVDIAINKEGRLWSGPKKERPLKANRPQPALAKEINKGRTYAIVLTPNGDEFAVPLDTSHLSEEIVSSIMAGFRVMLDPSVLEQIPGADAVLDEIFDNFDIDFRTPQGFGKYFKQFLYNADLHDPANLEEFNANKKDKRWVEWTGDVLKTTPSIRFMKAGGAINRDGVLHPKEVGVTTQIEGDPAATENLRTGLLEELEKHLNEMYFNITLEALEENGPVKFPILYETEEGLAYNTVEYASYKDYVKTVTETKLVGENIGNNEVTYFISPEIHFDSSFLGKPAEEVYGKPFEKPVEKSEESSTFKEEPPARSMTRRLNKSMIDKTAVTPKNIKDFLNYCS